MLRSSMRIELAPLFKIHKKRAGQMFLGKDAGIIEAGILYIQEKVQSFAFCPKVYYNLKKYDIKGEDFL